MSLTNRTSFPPRGGKGSLGPELVVVGSCNVDLVVRTPRLPQPGETLIADGVRRSNGGKGANQAVAAARLGASVALIAAIGDDDFGARLRGDLADEGIDVELMQEVPDAATGIAMITVDHDGENTIVVGAGANFSVKLDGIDLTRPGAVLAQLEVPLPVVVEAARRTAGLFCLNASPYQELPDELIERCDLIIVNETEYSLGRAQFDSAPFVCITLGARGARLLERGRVIAQAASPVVDAIDTVGAGDAFAGALVTEILRTGDPSGSLEFACRVGALTTTKVGAQESMPYRADVGVPQEELKK